MIVCCGYGRHGVSCTDEGGGDSANITYCSLSINLSII